MSMPPTDPRRLPLGIPPEIGAAVLVWVLGSAIGFAVGWLVSWWNGAVPVPRLTWLLLGSFGVIVGALTIVTSRERQRGPVAPETAAFRLALARTALYGGALVAGFFNFWVQSFITTKSPTPLQMERGIQAIAAIAAALVLAVAGWFLLTSLRVDPPQDRNSDVSFPDSQGGPL